MPIYEYRCRACEKTFEKLVRGDTKPTCPHCGADNVVKLMSGFAFRSTGSDGAVTKSSASSCSSCSRSSCAGCH